LGAQFLTHGKVLIALGANCPGKWGNPPSAIAYALRKIEAINGKVIAVSHFYETAPVGGTRQPVYVNAVALVETHLSPEALLRLLKDLERQSGRRGGGRPWGPRTLDIDIVDYSGLVRHWRGGKPLVSAAGARPLTLPHPLAHMRQFVLKPLLDVAPSWRHPVLRQSARQLLIQASRKREGQVLRRREASERR
jgi:2-amino-4-hydroxy-6-hydroxymethyldihydropteridine diphosphokinase